MANCILVVAHGTTGNQPGRCGDCGEGQAQENHSRSGTRRGAAATRDAREAPLASVPESALSAKERSRADWKRCSGFFSRQRRTMRSSAGGSGRPGSDNSGGSSFKTAVMVSAGVSRRKARTPESISYSTAPKAKMSVRRIGGFAADLLRRHVSRRAHDDARGGVRTG